MTRWIDEIKQLAKIAKTQPKAAYCHGLSNHWTFVSIANLLQPLDDAIQQHLIPALTKHPPCSREERDLLGLPACLGGLGILNPVSVSQYAFEASVRLTSSLVSTIATQNLDQTINTFEVLDIKAFIRQWNREVQEQQAKLVYDHITQQQKRQVDLARGKGASSRLSVLPLDNHNFSLHKGSFRDTICLQYTPTKCCYVSTFSTNHAMTYPKCESDIILATSEGGISKDD